MQVFANQSWDQPDDGGCNDCCVVGKTPNLPSALAALVLGVRQAIGIACCKRACYSDGIQLSPANQLALAILHRLHHPGNILLFAHSHGNAVVNAALNYIQMVGLEELLQRVYVVSMGSPVHVTILSVGQCWHLHHVDDLVWELAEPHRPAGFAPEGKLTVSGGHRSSGSINMAEPLLAHAVNLYISALRTLA